jgi:GT2 family glycosyltransferase
MPEYRVACVIPTHLRPALLSEALECVLGQQFDHSLATIVVDDAADSSTREVAERFAGVQDRPVMYLARSDGRPGASASRNAGASRSVVDSELLAFLDDDDLWTPNFLADAVRAFEANPDAAMVVSGLDVRSRDGSVQSLARIPEGLHFRQVSRDNPGFTGSNFVMRRESFDAIGGFDTELSVSNDKDLLVRFLRHGYTYVALPDGHVQHRHHDGERLTDLDERRADGLVRYVRKHRDNMPLADNLMLRSRARMIRSRVASRTTRRLAHAAVAVVLRGCSIALRSVTRANGERVDRSTQPDSKVVRHHE